MRPLAPAPFHTIAPVITFGSVGLVATAVSVIFVPGVHGLIGAVLSIIMLAVSIYDARYFIIPNILTAAAFALSLIHAVVIEPSAVMAAIAATILRGAVIALLFLAIKIAYEKLRGRQGIGMGDIKLAGVAGAWLDWLTMVWALEIAVSAALATYLLRQYFRNRPISATSAMPFGLFFAPAIWVGWLLEATLLAP